MRSLLNFSRYKFEKRTIVGTFIILIISLGVSYFTTYKLEKQLETAYNSLESPVLEDRYGKIIEIKPNTRGYFSRRIESIPERLENLLLKKEDRFFYYHLGINPISIGRDIFSYIFTGKMIGSSTLTQQLVKILLGNEQERTLANKLIEAVYTFSLEIHRSKKEILTMYVNTAYLGNQTEGFEEGGLFYFNKTPRSLSDNEIVKLLAALNSPSIRYPGSFRNEKIVPYLANVLGVTYNPTTLNNKYTSEERKSKTSFEMKTLGVECSKHCQLTIDNDLNESIRVLLKRNLDLKSFANVQNGAVVVIKIPENELISIVGSANPYSLTSGQQINMATQVRAIGSTIKPFIYLKAFEKGARPYTLVEDREYAYKIETGFPFYPKNFDGKYRGTVTLHQALSNSLNVPSVKVLEFVGFEKMYDFLRNSLNFKPVQPLENYGLGIAMGSLEMDLLTLANYFTIFPNEGILKPIKLFSDNRTYLDAPMSNLNKEKQVTYDGFTQLINKILSDRETAIDQFGMKGNLNLNSKNYALKTGTSRDYHDSWTIGYTPDFLVAVWLGNSDNTPMRQISGQLGAGKIWHDVMELLLNSPYNKGSPFRFDKIKEFNSSGTIEYGLNEDDYQAAKLLLKEEPIILHPHDGDIFLHQEKTIIPLQAKEPVDWFIDGVFLNRGESITWQPSSPGHYKILAKKGTGLKQKIKIQIEIEE